MKRGAWHVIKHVLFGLHSPSLLSVGRCWCQRNGPPKGYVPMNRQEVAECIERSYRRNWGDVQ